MPWEVRAVDEQRLEFCRLVEGGGVSVAVLCRRFGISTKTGFKWLARYRQQGVAGLDDRSRRPLCSPGQVAAGIEELVCAVREAHPVWGGRKIRGFLLRRGGLGVPAASTITQILRRRGLLVALPQRRAYGSFEHPAPNDLWQMDFKGWFSLSTGDRVHSLGVLDDHSRFNLCLQACSDQQTATVKGLLVSSFERYGLPWAMLMDNGSPWGNDAGQPWTPLTVWLMDLDIRVIHSRPRHPQTAGKEERFHRTLDLEVITTRNRWDSFDEVQGAYDAWRPIYNFERPHQSLGETTVPADRYQPSPRAFPHNIDPPDYPVGVETRLVSGACISWHSHRIRVGKAFTGKHVAITPTTTDGTYTINYRHHTLRTITLRPSPMSPNTDHPSPRS
jgi:transposase InsO family protein